MLAGASQRRAYHAREQTMARLRSIELTNFKNVGHGVVEFPSTSRPFEADILGIYGQNGSGKTAVIEALDILQSILLGMSLEHFSTDCIRFGFDEAELQIELDVQKDNTRQLEDCVRRLLFRDTEVRGWKACSGEGEAVVFKLREASEKSSSRTRKFG